MAAAAAVGAVVGIVGAISQGDAAKRNADMQTNIAGENASESRYAAAVNEQRLRIQSRVQLGDIRSGYASSGVNSSEGSALDVLSSSASQAEQDALLVRHGGQIQSLNYQREGQIARLRGDQAQRGAMYSAAGSLLSGGSKAYAMSRQPTSLTDGGS